MSEKLTIYIPAISDDYVSESLRELTKRVCLATGADGSGGLGGEYGYGSDFENDTFMMHQYCWCERDECPWCGDADAPNFRHKATGATVHWYKYIGRGMEVDNADWPAIFAECFASLDTTATGVPSND